MSDLEKIRQWLTGFPEYRRIKGYKVDYTDAVPNHGGIFPSGLVELSRSEDIIGNVTVRNQYNFGLYYVFTKSPGDDVGAAINADWLMDFQKWVQEQSVRGLAPTFGDEPGTERIQAQNGVLYDAADEGTATYMVQLSVTFTKIYEVI
jgi:hypothetical protein